MPRSALADSQIHRFLILHKELDPDDDELTRTRKVRRGFIAEVPAADRGAVQRPRRAHIETQVKFEDGRQGMVAADLDDPRRQRPCRGKPGAWSTRIQP